MTARSRTQAEQALAVLINAIRPDWNTPGILAAIRSKPGAPLDQLSAAAIYATTRRDQHTPHLIAEDDGNALDLLTGRLDVKPTPQPTRGCPYHHGQPKDCPECAEYSRQVTPPTRIAAIRAAHRKESE